MFFCFDECLSVIAFSRLITWHIFCKY